MQSGADKAKSGNLLVEGGRVFTPVGFVDPGVVAIVEGRIAYVGAPAQLPAEFPSAAGRVLTADLPRYDARGLLVSPGFIDVHIHGGGGTDTMHGTVQDIQTVARTHGAHGTTAVLSTTATAPAERLMEVVRAVAAAVPASWQPDWGGAEVLGLHLEGPYLSEGKRGADNPVNLRVPSRSEIEELLSILGPAFRLITLAPELSGALEVIKWLSGLGITVSLGHSEVEYEAALSAIDAGAHHATHVYNGMVPLHHRDPGLLAAVLTDDRVTVELIADGVHVATGAMRLVWKAKPRGRVCLITDAMAATGMGPGRYMLSDMEVIVEGEVCKLASTGTLASSVLTMDRAVKNSVEMVGVDLAEALRAATEVPARQAGVGNRKGSLEVGKDGDLAILGPDLLCRATVVAGRVLG